MSGYPVVKLWLEGVFDSKVTEELIKQGLKEELRRAALWYKSYRNELLFYGFRNNILERLVLEYNEKLSKEELRVNLRAFMEKLYYEAFIRKAGRGTI